MPRLHRPCMALQVAVLWVSMACVLLAWVYSQAFCVRGSYFW